MARKPNLRKISGGLYEIDARTKLPVSPKGHADFGGHYTRLDAAWDMLDRARNAEEFHKIIATLVFHARHLHPAHHAELARLLTTPFTRERGRPPNPDTQEQVETALRIVRFLGLKPHSSPRKENAEIAASGKLSKEAARQRKHRYKTRK